MAHVGISQPLISEVKNNINSMGIKERDMQLGKLHETMPEVPNGTRYANLSPEEANDLHLEFWGVHSPLAAQIPDEWKVKREDFRCKWEDDYISPLTGEVVNHYLYFTVYCTQDNPYTFPPNTSSYGDLCISGRPLFAEAYVAYLNAKNVVVAKVKKKYDTIADQVVGYLQSCKSLNAAVKALPDIKLYIPQSYLDRLEVKVERNAAGAKAEEHAAVVDTTLIVSTAVMHKFMRAQA